MSSQMFNIDIKPSISSPTMSEPHLLPTPPTSPPPDPAANSSVVLLNSLVQFYQSESLWVHRTRAALELALSTRGREAITAAAVMQNAQIPSAPSPPMTDVEDSVKMEPPSSPALIGKTHPLSRWMQRKKSFKLKLEGMPNSLAVARRRRARRSADVPTAPETGTRLLELFGQLMEARMESCHRVNQLVQEANRPDLYTR
ncbi:hypothetical protein EW146_g7595 [Bondarzewia mesenterica]|uniref:Uncharacterized protein n=1 Tax=Bondarzewia mesenterica TaxID=1095465 RepID=A0A4S4LQZ2_9AGAM|nr:hypothetical protein EW146_g7595 [Bondarzewia mesenterica]